MTAATQNAPFCARRGYDADDQRTMQIGESGVKDAEKLITERDLLGEVAGRLAVGSQNNRVPANFAGWQVRPAVLRTGDGYPASGLRG